MKFKAKIVTLCLLIFMLFSTNVFAAGDVQSIEGVSKVKNLETLSLVNQNLTNVPDELGYLTKLKYLNLSGNNLTVISNGILSSDNLETLDLSNNQLTSIPNNINQLVNLKSFSIANNTQITSLPDNMKNMTKLTSIDVSNTGIKCLPLAMEPIAITDKKPAGITYGLTVTYDTQGGNAIDSIRVDQDQLIPSAPVEPVKDGFTFGGWFSDSSCTKAWNFTTNTVPDHMTLYAKWNGKPSVIQFEENSGSVTADLTGVTDQSITNRSMPSITRSGYTLAGWFADSGCTGTAITELPATYPIGGATYYAKWTADASVISFVENEGSPATDLTGVTDQSIDNRSMPSITRDGYTLLGWFADSGCTGAVVTELPAAYPVGGATYYAKWSANASVISFVENEGSAAADLTGVTDQSITNRSMPSIMRSGYTLDGWFSDSGCTGTAITELPATYPVGGATYYAKWTADASVISFVENEGSPATDLTGVTDQSIDNRSMPSITRDGYTLLGWFADSGCTGTVVTELPAAYPVGGATYYAKWSADASHITFIENGGSPATDLTGETDQTIDNRSMPVITRDGYTLAGWCTDSGCTGEVVAQLPDKYPVTGIIYYAKWLAIASNITFEENGGSPAASDLGGTTDQTISNRTMPTVSRSGYTFGGWFADSGCTGTEVAELPATYPVGGITYYAKWTAYVATIKFATNEGSAIADMTGVTDQAINPTTMPVSTRTGYTLSGWYTDSGFTSPVVTNLPAAYPVGTTTYYAKWLINTYNVVFESNGGTAVASTTATYNTTVSTPTQPTKADAFFDSWCADAALTTPWDFANNKITADTTIYAKWTDLPPAGQPLESYTWEQIKLISNAGKGDDYFNVKDEKLVNINGTNYTFQIYGFNHDDKADGSGKANITFGMKGVMAASHVMNPANTNQYGWVGSDMRGWLNGVYTTNQSQDYTTGTTSIWSQLPAELKAQITTVKKYTSGGYYDQTLKTSTDNLFLFSTREVAGVEWNTLAGEGQQYPIFTDDASRIKTYPNTSAAWWWLRSPYYANSNFFTGVNSNGTYNTYDIANYYYGVAFGFSI